MLGCRNIIYQCRVCVWCEGMRAKQQHCWALIEIDELSGATDDNDSFHKEERAANNHHGLDLHKRRVNINTHGRDYRSATKSE